MSPRGDLLVLGAGPAALMLAWRAAERGLSVRVVAPNPIRPWSQQFATWRADLAGTELLEAVERLYSRPIVALERRRIELDRAYARLSTPRMQAVLRERCRAFGVELVWGAAAQIVEHREGATVLLTNGASLEAAAVVDATGAGSGLVGREERRPAFQAAYGLEVEVDDHPYAEGEMALMDLRGAEGPDPSFLYALPLGPERIFLEETSLVRRPALSLGLLQERLAARLKRLEIRVRRVVSREHCLIAMGTGLPLPSQRTIAFGAAAGMIHPATGYSLGHALRLSPVVAKAIAEGLDRSPAEASERAQAALWPEARRRAWELYAFGMELLSDLDGERLSDFLDAFFGMPPHRWHPFMRGTLAPRGILTAMGHVFVRAEPLLRARLMRAAFTSPGLLYAARRDVRA